MKFRVWAPRAERVELVFAPSGERAALRSSERGYFEIDHPRFVPGVRYQLSLDGGPLLPDPRSRYQPEGVHGPSECVDLSDFEWSDSGFAQVPLAEAVLYELHVGTFSKSGSFAGVVEHLTHLKTLGVTHIELMPVAAFPGRWGWGYDGVDLYAVHAAYGGPRALMELVDACHREGIAVILDCVYNHLGPSGNYLGQFGPYFTGRYGTPWGEALNFDGAGSDEVRRYICDNALYWLENFHIDGLRLDAVHAIFDQSATHILEQLAAEVDAAAERLGKPLVLVAESHLNDPRFVRPRQLGGYGLSSQWSDDFHHALRAVLTGELDGYYADYGDLEQLATALKSGFVYQGQYSKHRGHSYGRPPEGLRGRHFHAFNQNHDQVGNRALGDRLGDNVSDGALKIAAALTLFSPFVPMLFMGEEWGATAAFRYFTDHGEPELADAVREGRRREFAAFGWDPSQIPDPQDPRTVDASTLDWSELDRDRHRQLLEWYRSLVTLRREKLKDDDLSRQRVDFSETQRWLLLDRGSQALLVNFANTSRELPTSLFGAVDSGAKLLLTSEQGSKWTESAVVLPPQSAIVVEKGR